MPSARVATLPSRRRPAPRRQRTVLEAGTLYAGSARTIFKTLSSLRSGTGHAGPPRRIIAAAGIIPAQRALLRDDTAADILRHVKLAHEPAIAQRLLR